MAYEKDWSASAELNGMRKNPLFNRLRAQSTIDTGRYGNLVQDVANYSKMSRGRESLNKFGNAQKGLYVPGDNIGPAVNRRTAAATGSNADWAWPKLHDPFEWFRERCILPGEMMNLRDGRKRVEDVVVGDIALTHKGRYRKVIGLGHKSYEGKAYSVEPYYLSKAKVTEDHPFWAKKNLSDEPDWIKVQHLSKKDWVFIPVDREVGDVDTINILDHLDADDWVVEDGYIAYKKNDVHYRTRSLGNQVSVKFEVSDEFLWLLGLYLAEGYSNDKSISWYISNQEFYIKDRIIDSCKQLFNIDARYSENKNDNTFNVCLTAQPLATLFHKWCGKNAHDKHLPEWVMYLPIEKQRVILEGILDGDGCYQDDKIYFLSVSPQFTEQVRRLMLRCGYFPSISHRSKKDFKTQIKIEGTNTALILLGNDQYKFLNDINAIANDGFVYNKRLTGRYKPINRKQRFVTHQEKNGVWVQIRDIEKFDYKGEIYYFTVDEDHSFTISDQGVRNTWWFNMEDPDEQTRKIRDWSASPDSLVLMGDYTWKRIGDISEGEEVIGWESYTTKNSTKQRLTKTKVVAIKHRIAPNTVKVTMSSGRTMIVTDDHMWANYNYSPAVTSRVNRQRNVIKEQENQRISAGELFNIGFTSGQVARKMGIKVSTAEKWHAIWVKEGMDGLKSSINYMDASELKSAEYVTSHVGAELKFVATPPRQLITDEEKFAAGYIAAMIDGEGFIDKTTVSITQSPTINPDICKKIEECLDILGIPYKLRVETKGKNSFSEGKIINRYYFQGTPNAHGTRQAVLDLHNMTNKGSVKINRHIDKMFLTANFGSKETVVDVEPLGEGPVVSMQTGTGNYIQDGYASKNCRLIYTTHYLVPSMIDIYSRFPLLGMEFAHPDKRVNEFFSELFWDGLQYQDFLYSLSREHWLIGDAFALGSWNDGIGAWEADELINPNDVVVAKNRALRTYQYHIKVPEEVKKLVETRQPEKEYAMLMAMYPDVVEYARKDVEIPVSDVIMKGLPYRTNPWAEHGTPILMRAFRQLMMEESLQASMEAISDRLYSPLILATLGLPDADQDGPWIPDAEELGALRDDLAMAINADFRLMVYHHGLQIQNAFGRESMPRLDQDFYRIQANYMMVFGIGSELLQGGKSGATYASGALNRELITQMLTTHQHQIKHFIQGRMRAVAERQGFYEYRNVGGHPVPVMETVLVVDEETGAQFVEERPKLAIPDIIFQSMSLQDENVEHAFLQQLAGMGFPISFQTFTRNVGIDFEDEVETRKKEKVDLVVAEQQLKKDIFDRCFQLQLPIPMEYQAEYEAYIMQLQDPQLAEQIRPGAINDITSMTPTPNISGTPVHVDAGGIPDMYPSIANQETLKQRQHPVESHEQKKTEPKRSKGGPKNGPQKKTASLADIDLEEDDILVISRRTNEPIVFEDGSIISNLGAEGKEWGSYRKHNPKKASVTEEVQNDKVVTYSDSLKLSVPWESQYRVQMKLANGQRVVVDNEYEKYDEVYMKDHIAKILESNVDSSEDDSFDDRLNEQIIPTRMDFGEHHPGMMGFDERAIVGVPTEDMGPKVTFGAVEFPNRKNLNNNKDVIEHKD